MRPTFCKSALILLALIGSAASQATPVRLDNSDWWSQLRTGEWPVGIKSWNRAPATTNFEIDGLFVNTDFSKIQSKYGKATVVQRGDASTYRSQLCYASLSGNVHLIFEVGEIENVAYLFKDGHDWTGSHLCTKSARITNRLLTASGLKLGVSPADVRRILGPPSTVVGDRTFYLFEYRHKTSAKELVALRKSTPDMSDAEVKKFLEFGDVTAYIEARFVHGKLNYLAISRSETY